MQTAIERAAGYLAMIEAASYGVSHCDDNYRGSRVTVVSDRLPIIRGRSSKFKYQYWVNGKRVYGRDQVIARMAA